MLSCIVNSFQIFNIDDATAITIEFGESKKYLWLSAIVHFTNDSSQEIIVVYGATSIAVEKCKDSLNLSLVSWDSIVLHGFSEFTKIESFGLVVIHDLKYSADSVDSTDTTSGQFLPKREQKFFICLFQLGRGGWRRAALDKPLLLNRKIRVVNCDCLSLVYLDPSLNSSGRHLRCYGGLLSASTMSLVDFLNILFHWSFIQVAKERAMHVVLPLLTTVFAVERGMNPARRNLYSTNHWCNCVN